MRTQNKHVNSWLPIENLKQFPNNQNSNNGIQTVVKVQSARKPSALHKILALQHRSKFGKSHWAKCEVRCELRKTGSAAGGRLLRAAGGHCRYACFYGATRLPTTIGATKFYWLMVMMTYRSIIFSVLWNMHFEC